MIKKLLLCAVIGVVLGLAWTWYMSARNTPERAAAHFTEQLVKGETGIAYRRLTTELTKGRQQYWEDYLTQFKNEKSQPELVAQDQTDDSFNTYTEANDPRHFTYKLKVAGKTYQMTIILIKQHKNWNVDELHGDYL